MKNLPNIPRELTKDNIQSAISNYCKLLEDFPLKVEAGNVLDFLAALKREKIEADPYPNVTLFESANRIMTDLTILYGVKSLLDGDIPEINYDKYEVEFGHENNNDFDISAKNKTHNLVGEAFNVAEQFFQSKKTKMLRKLRKQREPNDQILLIYNSDAVSERYEPKLGLNEFHLRVKLKLWK